MHIIMGVRTVMVWCLLVILEFSLVSSEVSMVDYSGYTLTRVQVHHEDQMKFLMKLIQPEDVATDHSSVWDVNRIDLTLDIFHSASMGATVRNYIKDHKLTSTTMIEDIQRQIDENAAEDANLADKMRQKKTRGKRSATELSRDDHGIPNSVINRYSTLEEIEEWMEVMAEEYSEFFKVENLGTTSQERNIKIVKIGHEEGNPKPVMLMVGTAHAREWASHATLLITIYQLVLSRVTNNEFQDLTQHTEWHVIPVLNPDGFVYTHSNDRLWRKNRKSHHTPSKCDDNDGVDLNRNFAVGFGVGVTSSNPCDRLYHGPEPLSELESKALSNHMLAYKDLIKFEMDVHAYSQLITTRWAYTIAENITNYDELLQFAVDITEEIKLYSGAVYRPCSAPKCLYAFGGGISDYAYGVAGIPYTYSAELRDKGRYGFLLPARLINVTAMEFFTGMVHACRRVISEFTNATSVSMTTARMTETETMFLNEDTTTMNIQSDDKNDVAGDTMTTEQKVTTTVMNIQSEKSATHEVMTTEQNDPTLHVQDTTTIKNIQNDNENIATSDTMTTSENTMNQNTGLPPTDQKSEMKNINQTSAATITCFSVYLLKICSLVAILRTIFR